MSKLAAVDQIDPSPWADLFEHPEEHIQRLAEDIAERGVQTPLHVYPRSDRYELLAGHDRLEAAKRAGLSEVPIEVRSTLNDEDERFEYFLKDNTLRKAVNPRAIAREGLKRWTELSNREIARRIGVSDQTVRRVREEMEEAGEVRPSRTITGVDGVKQPAHKPHREPKPESKLDAQRRLREQAAPPNAGYPEGVVVGSIGAGEPSVQDRVEAETKAVEDEVRRSAWQQLTKYLVDQPIPPKLTDEQIMEAVSDPDYGEIYIRKANETFAFNERVKGAQEARKDMDDAIA